MAVVSVSIDVSDMEKATLFYTKALGCVKLRIGSDTTKLSTDNVNIFFWKRKRIQIL